MWLTVMHTARYADVPPSVFLMGPAAPRERINVLGKNSRLQLRDWWTSADETHYVKRPWPSFLLTSDPHQSLSSYDKSISLCVQEQQDVSWKEAGRAGLAWTCEAKMKEPPDISTQLSQTDRVEGKCSSPYNLFV